MTGIVHKKIVVSRDKGLAADWNDDHEITGDVDLDQNSFLNQVVENRTDFPAGPVTGQIIFRSDEGNFYGWNGTAWQNLTSKDTSQVVATAEDDHTLPLATFTQMNSMNVTHNSITGKVLVMFSATIWPGLANFAEIKLQKDGGDVNGALREAYYTGVDESGAATCAIQTIDTNAGNNTWRIMWRVAFGADDLIAYDRVLTIVDI